MKRSKQEILRELQMHGFPNQGTSPAAPAGCKVGLAALKWRSRTAALEELLICSKPIALSMGSQERLL